MAIPAYTKPLLSGLSELLRPLGFRRNDQRFVRQVNDCFQIIHLQASQFGDQHRQSYTLNLAVYCTSLEPLGKDASKLKEYEGHWQSRIGTLVFQGRDHWWQVGSEADAELAAREIAAVMPRVLEAMDQISSLEGMLRIKPGRGVTSADPPGHCRWTVLDAHRAKA